MTKRGSSGRYRALRLQAERDFAAAQQSADEAAFEPSGYGPARESAATLAARERLQRAAADAQSVFLTQLAMAHQRPTVAPAKLPEALIDGVRSFDAVIAECLDVDRRSGTRRGASRPARSARVARRRSPDVMQAQEPTTRESGGGSADRGATGTLSRAGAAHRTARRRRARRMTTAQESSSAACGPRGGVHGRVTRWVCRAAAVRECAARRRIDPGRLRICRALLRRARRDRARCARRASCRSTLSKTYELERAHRHRAAHESRRRASPGSRPGRRQSPLGLAEGTYYPAPRRGGDRRGRARSGADSRPRVVPGGVFTADTQFVIPVAQPGLGVARLRPRGALSWTRRRRWPWRRTSVSMPSTSRSSSR